MQRHGIPTARVRDLHRRRRGARLRRPQGRADRGQGRRPGGRQGRGRGARRSPRRTKPSTACWLDDKLGRTHNAGGARVVIEEFLAGRGGQLHRAVRRQERAAAGHQPGPQAPARRRPGPQHRRHGRLLAGAGGHARTCTRAPCARSSCPPSRHGEGRHPLHRLPVRRPDDRRARPAQDAGVQLPPGRPGDAADHDAAEDATCSRCWCTPPTARSTRSSCNGTAAPRWAW